jgi:transcriptional regulator with PAS, ATPase and Fis domain
LDVDSSRERLETFSVRFLKMLTDEVPSDLAVIVLLGGDGRSVFNLSWPRQARPEEISAEGIIQQAVREQRPVLANRSSPLVCRHDGRMIESEKNLLCLPLGPPDHPAGAVCLCRGAELGPYSAQDLEFLAFLAPALQRNVEQCRERTSPIPDPVQEKSADLIIGTSPASISIRGLIDKVKDIAAPVFIYGESGTGKDLVARSIHERGARRTGPFIAVNCGAIPDHLLESELFGHTRGAFTGALREKAGLIEAADRGTFFLDEVGDLSLPLQAKLLRLLQEREVRRIGETRTRRVDVRFISATNKDLEREIERGNFRMDLYYRLRILTIDVPPLRERKGDLLLLINHFLSRYSQEMRRERAYVSPHALELMMSYSWPGNVRELQNEVQRALILAAGEDLIGVEHLSPKLNPQGEYSTSVSYSYFEAKAEFEKRFLRQALHRFGHNKARTAAEVGLTRQGLFKLLKKHNLTAKPGDRPA